VPVEAYASEKLSEARHKLLPVCDLKKHITQENFDRHAVEVQERMDYEHQKQEDEVHLMKEIKRFLACRRNKFSVPNKERPQAGFFKDFTVLSDGKLACLGTNDYVYVFSTSPVVELKDMMFNKYHYQARVIAAKPLAEPILAVAGRAGLSLMECGANCRQIFKLKGDFQKLEWSPSGRYLGVIRNVSDTKTETFMIDLHDKFNLIRVPASSGASFLSFSPFEKWLIIGLQATAAQRSPFKIVSLHDFTSTTFEIVQIESDHNVNSVSSVVWTRDELYFLTHVENSNILQLWGQNLAKIFEERTLEERTEANA